MQHKKLRRNIKHNINRESIKLESTIKLNKYLDNLSRDTLRIELSKIVEWLTSNKTEYAISEACDILKNAAEFNQNFTEPLNTRNIQIVEPEPSDKVKELARDIAEESMRGVDDETDFED